IHYNEIRELIFPEDRTANDELVYRREREPYSGERLRRKGESARDLPVTEVDLEVSAATGRSPSSDSGLGMTVTDMKNRPLQRIPYRPMSAEPILHRAHFHPTPQKLPTNTTNINTTAIQQHQHEQQLLQQQQPLPPPLPPTTSSISSSSTNFYIPHHLSAGCISLESHHASLRHIGGGGSMGYGFGLRWAGGRGSSSSTSKIMGPTHSSTTHNTPQKQFLYKTNEAIVVA
ncbi:hypothetical protein DOY81_008796, partial [Sarcophaga bullata]